jgi:hypothetical protein
VNWSRFWALVAVLAIAVAFWLMVSSAFANWQMPPARFDHEPTVPYEVRYRSAQVLNFYCGEDAMHPKVGGCAIIDKGRCWITIAAHFGRQDRASVLRHEKAHCNGWRH